MAEEKTKTASRKKPKFLRKDVHKMSKLGKGRKKKQIWRAPKGRDNKMREKKKGHRKVVSIGYGSPKEVVKEILMINNLADLKKINENKIAVVGNIGKKKKLAIAEEAKKMKIVFKNMNPEKYLEKNQLKKKVEEKVETKKENKTSEEKK